MEKPLIVEAVELLKLAVKKQPTAVHQYHLGMSFLKNGDSVLGQENIAKALAKDPNIFKTEVGW